MITGGITQRVLFEQKLEGVEEQYRDLLRHRKQSVQGSEVEVYSECSRTANKPVWLRDSEQEGADRHESQQVTDQN